MPDYYGTLAGYRAYHTARGRELDIADQDDDEITSSLLVASEWIDGRYFINFAGTPTGMRDQIRQWPRNECYDNNGYHIPQTLVPREVENATYEAAYRAEKLNEDYTPDRYKSARIEGAINVEFVSFNSAQEMQTQFPVIDAILAPLMTAKNSGVYSSFSGVASRV